MTHVVKRYAGVRLYDTATLSYTTVAALRAIADEVVVLDAKTGEDVTRQIMRAS